MAKIRVYPKVNQIDPSPTLGQVFYPDENTLYYQVINYALYKEIENKVYEWTMNPNPQIVLETLLDKDWFDLVIYNFYN